MAKVRSKRVPLEAVRWRLGKVWFISAALVFTMLIIQSLAGVYEDKVQAVWGWALPNFLPTLMLMVGVFAGTALADEVETDHMHVRAPFATLATWLSIFHVFALLLTLLVRPFLPMMDGAPAADVMSLLETSNLWLGPTQGLAGAVIGALFFSKSSATNAGAAN